MFGSGYIDPEANTGGIMTFPYELKANPVLKSLFMDSDRPFINILKNKRGTP